MTCGVALYYLRVKRPTLTQTRDELDKHWLEKRKEKEEKQVSMPSFISWF